MNATKTIAIAALWIVIAVITGGNAASQTSRDKILVPKELAIIMDRSGSMNSNIYPETGESAASIGKGILSSLLNRAKEIYGDGHISVLQFGTHHPQGSTKNDPVQKAKSCADITYLQKRIRSRDLDSQDILKRLGPVLGDTPIIESIRRASATMKNGGSIILISDMDKYVCTKGGPQELCSIWEKELSVELESRGIVLRHIVALPRQTKNGNNLRIFANCTGAKFIEFKDNPRDIGRSVIDDHDTISTPAHLNISLAQSDADITPPNWQQEVAVNFGSGRRTEVITLGIKQNRKLYDDLRPFPVKLSSQSKTYRVALKRGRNNSKRADIQLPIQKIQLTHTLPEGPDSSEILNWEITGHGTVFRTGNKRTPIFKLFPGSYEVSAKNLDYSGKINFRVTPGSDALHNIELSFVRIAPAPKPLAPQLKNGTVLVELTNQYTAFGDNISLPEISLVNSNDRSIIVEPRKEMEMAASQYTIKLNQQAVPNESFNFTLLAEEDKRIKINLTGTPIRASAVGSNAETVWVLKRGDKELTYKGERFLQYVPPGTYELEVWLNEQKSSQTIRIDYLFSSERKILFD